MPDLSPPLENSIAALTYSLPERHPPVESPPYVYGLDAGTDTATYKLWLQIHEEDRRRHAAMVATRFAGDRRSPTITVAVPVYQPDEGLLEACVNSVVGQSYDKWELCLCDDSSPDDGRTAALLQAIETRDARIRVTSLASNAGISGATNAAARLGSGAFIAFLDQDDELEFGILGDIAAAILDDPTTDVVYTDQDKLDHDGRSEPYFKPGWSPDLLLSNMYMAHLLVIRRTVFEQLGGLRTEFDGSQDYDLALRATEVARKVTHVPVVGYHWRRTPGSTALDYGAKPNADRAARAALASAMERRNVTATIESGLLESTFRVRRVVPDPAPLVSIIVPFHNDAPLLRRCVDGITELAGYENWELVLVDNQSWHPEIVGLLRQLENDQRIRVLEYDAPFNWSAINNWAAAESRGDVLLFMNSDVEGIRAGWLEAMVEHAVRPEVGAVGARLLYPDGKVQHAGVVLGLGAGVAWHAFCFCPPEQSGYFGHARMIRNYSAVTGACMMVRREIFRLVGGFDESLEVAFNDIDFSIRVRERDLLIVYTPYAELTHYEGASRGRGAQETAETREMFRRWGRQIRNDPYFNPNLSKTRSEFALDLALEEVDPWARVL